MDAASLERFRKAFDTVLMSLATEDFPDVGLAAIITIYDDGATRKWHIHSTVRADYSLPQELSMMEQLRQFVKKHRARWQN